MILELNAQAGSDSMHEVDNGEKHQCAVKLKFSSEELALPKEELDKVIERKLRFLYIFEHGIKNLPMDHNDFLFSYIRTIKDEVNKTCQDSSIKNKLESIVTLYKPIEEALVLFAFGEELRFLLGVSEVRVMVKV
jgi:hypothetical protein